MTYLTEARRNIFEEARGCQHLFAGPAAYVREATPEGDFGCADSVRATHAPGADSRPEGGPASVTAPRLLLDTSRAYFASTPRV